MNTIDNYKHTFTISSNFHTGQLKEPAGPVFFCRAQVLPAKCYDFHKLSAENFLFFMFILVSSKQNSKIISDFIRGL
jgi:hypothetical protein